MAYKCWLLLSRCYFIGRVIASYWKLLRVFIASVHCGKVYCEELDTERLVCRRKWAQKDDEEASSNSIGRRATWHWGPNDNDAA